MKRIFITFSTVLLSVMCHGQGTTFCARVLDANSKEPLPLVGVYIDEERNTLTNFDGEFCITATPDETIRLTCIGHKTQMIKASELTERKGTMAVIRMPMVASTLSEVTVKAVENKLLQRVVHSKRKNIISLYHQLLVLNNEQLIQSDRVILLMYQILNQIRYDGMLATNSQSKRSNVHF